MISLQTTAITNDKLSLMQAHDEDRLHRCKDMTIMLQSG